MNNQNDVDDDDSLLDSLTDDYLEEVINQSTAKFSQSSSSSTTNDTKVDETLLKPNQSVMKADAFRKIDQIESQAVDFTTINVNPISVPSLKGSNTILGKFLFIYQVYFIYLFIILFYIFQSAPAKSKIHYCNISVLHVM